MLLGLFGDRPLRPDGCDESEEAQVHLGTESRQGRVSGNLQTPLKEGQFTEIKKKNRQQEAG